MPDDSPPAPDQNINLDQQTPPLPPTDDNPSTAPPPPPWASASQTPVEPAKETTPQEKNLPTPKSPPTSMPTSPLSPPPPPASDLPGQMEEKTIIPPPAASDDKEKKEDKKTPEAVSPPSPSFSTSSVAASPAGAGAKPKPSIFKYLIPLLGFLAFVAILYFIVTRFVLPYFSGEVSLPGTSKKETPTEKASLTYWGLWEPESVMNQIITDYQQTHPNVSINYTKQSPKDYRERLQSALISGSGPDIFRLHNTWVPMLKNELEPAPSGTIDLSVFYLVVSDDLKISQKTYAVPLEFDGLALFYNPQILQQAGKSVPTTWEELRNTAAELTVKDATGKIQTAGVALGTTNNVDNFSDILGLMILQNGGDPGSPTSQLVQDAVQFYTIFTSTDQVWDETLPSSTYAFATEKVAMFFAPSWRAFQIKETNPDLEFATAPVPQLPGPDVAWASYWAEGVAKRSENTDVAWEFLEYLSSKEAVTKLYTAESNLRLFGEPYSLKELGSSLESDSYVGAFVKQGSYAKSWYLCSRTFDNGLNDRIIKYYEDAVNDIINGKDIETALNTTSSGVSQILSQYGISQTPAQQVSEPETNTPSSTSTPETLEEI